MNKPKADSCQRKVITALLIFTLMTPLLGICTTETQAAPELASAYDLIAAVNQLRSANGLPSYQANASLMSIAQAHSEYQASIGSITHTGPGGTRPKDRAIAAGYGGGATVYVSENIAGGASTTVSSVIQMWQGDSLHLSTMLSASYIDVGAGIANSGGMTYYTLDVGYIAGSAGSASSSSSGATSANPAATQISFFPVLIATPAPDGSVIHEVQPGQTLWTIAAAYDIDIAELLQRNGLTQNSFIYPGNNIIIIPAAINPTPKTMDTNTPTQPKPTTTRKPTRTATQEVDDLTRVDQVGLPADSKVAIEAENPIAWNNPILVAIAVLVVGGIALFTLGIFFKREG